MGHQRKKLAIGTGGLVATGLLTIGCVRILPGPQREFPGVVEKGSASVGAEWAASPIGFLRISRGVQGLSRSMSTLAVRVSAVDMAASFEVQVPVSEDASASAAIACPAGSNRRLSVAGFNGAGVLVASGSVANLAVSPGAFTDVAVPLAPTVGDLLGTVTNGEDRMTQPGVVVSAGAASASTDRDGNFALTDLPAGPLDLVFSQPGYSTITIRNLTVTAGTSSVVPAQTIWQTHWTRQASGVTQSDLLCAVALSSTEVYAAGAGGTIIHTKDGGKDWLLEPLATATGSAGADIFDMQAFGSDASASLYAFTATGVYAKLSSATTWQLISSDLVGPGFTNDQIHFITGKGPVLVYGTASSSTTFAPSGNSGSDYRSLLLTYYNNDNTLAFGPGSTQIVRFKNVIGDDKQWVSNLAKAETDIFSPYGMFADDKSFHSLFTYGSYGFAVGASGSLNPHAVIRWSHHGFQGEEPDFWYLAPPNALGGTVFRSIKPLWAFPVSGDGSPSPSKGFIAVGTRGEIAIFYPSSIGWNLGRLRNFEKSVISDDCPGCRTADLNDSAFFDTSTGWIVGDQGMVFRY